MKKEKTSACIGRPREFDLDEALDRVLDVFWRKGYEGASLTDLTEAVGVNRPSLYAAFGNKEELFRKALDRYEERSACTFEVLDQPCARAAMEDLLLKTISFQLDPERPRGCLMVQGALVCADSTEPIREELVARRERAQDHIRLRLEKAAADGQLPAGVTSCALARYFSTILQGLSVQSAGGASYEDLLPVVEVAMRVWPEEESA